MWLLGCSEWLLGLSEWLLWYFRWLPRHSEWLLTGPSQKSSPAVSVHAGAHSYNYQIHTETIKQFLTSSSRQTAALRRTASHLKPLSCRVWSGSQAGQTLTYRWFDSNGRRLFGVDAVSCQSHRLHPEHIVFIGLQAINYKPERRRKPALVLDSLTCLKGTIHPKMKTSC